MTKIMRTLLASFKYALSGIRFCINNERNMKIHLIAAAIVILLAWQLKISSTEVVVLVLTIMMVFVAEMINTAIEKVVDLISPQYHYLAKVAKDVAAGAVLVAALGAILIGCILFYPKLIN